MKEMTIDYIFNENIHAVVGERVQEEDDCIGGYTICHCRQNSLLVKVFGQGSDYHITFNQQLNYKI